MKPNLTAVSGGSLVEKFDLGRKVAFIGRIDHSVIRQFYESIDIYVALDDGPSEAKISVQEAMMCGCAVISGESRVKDMALKEEWGYIVNPYSVSDIRIAINSLCCDPQELSNMKNNAKRYADDHFSENAISKMYYNMFEEIV